MYREVFRSHNLALLCFAATSCIFTLLRRSSFDFDTRVVLTDICRSLKTNSTLI